MDNIGFVKLPRSLLYDEWALNPTTFAVFAYVLSLANYEEKEWNGRIIPRGAAIVSLRGISDHFRGRITPGQVRTAIKNICKNGVAQVIAQPDAQPAKGPNAHRSAHPCTAIIICNYDSYNGNGNGKRTPQRTPQNTKNAQPLTQNGALTKEINKENIKDLIGNDIWLLPILEDWIAYKKEKGQAYKGRKGITQFCNRLKELSCGKPEEARKIVNEAMAANYSTIYPLKEKTLIQRAINANPRININSNAPEEATSTI